MVSRAHLLLDSDDRRLVFIDALRVALSSLFTTPRKPTVPLAVFGPCMIARKATGLLPSTPQMRRLAWD
jgi:hypothetical protein